VGVAVDAGGKVSPAGGTAFVHILSSLIHVCNEHTSIRDEQRCCRFSTRQSC